MVSRRQGDGSPWNKERRNTMSKEVVRENISADAVRSLDMSKVMAIVFAEVGAQGMPNHVEVISDQPDQVSVISGRFGFEAYGRRVVETVDIAELERVVPFLKLFRGIHSMIYPLA